MFGGYGGFGAELASDAFINATVPGGINGSINGRLQINLHLTDFENENKYLQHDCLYAVTSFNRADTADIITAYCMGEWPSKWNIKENDIDQKMTFENLSKQGITSEQLYHWSAPIDIIEDYQFYLNNRVNSKSVSMATKQFYNCTLPFFGPKCQYVLNDHKIHHSSLNEIVHDYYYSYIYVPTIFTCYIHLQCNRGPSPSCLDWTEICDGKNDCLDGEQDEENCWQLEIQRGTSTLDDSGFYYKEYYEEDLPTPEPTILSEDISCQKSLHLTSSCVIRRNDILLQAIFSVRPESLSNECWSAFKCMTNFPIVASIFNYLLCSIGTETDIMRKTCPDIVYTPAVPILLGHIYLAYNLSEFSYDWEKRYDSTYVCYDHRKLRLPDDNKTLLFPDNRTCRLYTNSKLPEHLLPAPVFSVYYILPLWQWLSLSTLIISNDSIFCNQSNMYQCLNSHKCISKTRLLDKVRDCYFNDDEDRLFFNGNCSPKWNYEIFQCSHTNICIASNFVNDHRCDCPIDKNGFCDDEFVPFSDIRSNILFRRICDNFTGLDPIIIDGQIHTDETECEQWPCNNLYSRCDGIWNCYNGIDEMNCYSPPVINCPSNNHICLSVETLQFMCLPLEKVNDDHIDCIGAADEPMQCPANNYANVFQRFHCRNDNSTVCLRGIQLCDNIPQCTNGEDEQNCTVEDMKNYHVEFGICRGTYQTYRSNIAKVFCPTFYQNERMLSKLFIKQYLTDDPSTQDLIETKKTIIEFIQPRCHRGLDVQIWLDKNKTQTTNTCLCPPSYYGDICQYQNQRIILTLGIVRVSEFLQTPFIVSISLIDNSNERTIHSNEQFVYLSNYHCGSKFYIYLLYSNRPKNSSTQYSVHIDIYNKRTLTYRASILKPILFPFLPVYRLNFQLDIPAILFLDHSYCSDSQCINGQCRRYFNDTNNATFCQCYSGWSGRYCTIRHTCTCSDDSLCLGQLANNRSLCLCPLNKIGPRCLLENFICQNNSDIKCLNGGECIPINEHQSIGKQFGCICPKTHIGDRCEINQTTIIITFNKDVIVPTAIRIQFLYQIEYFVPFNKRIYKTVPFGHDSVTVYISNEYNIMLLEWLQNYYLGIFQNRIQQGTIIQKTIYAKDRCLHISELFNQTILNYHQIRRIKYYHVPCRTKASSNLRCFYDDINFCMCVEHAGERVAHCIDFNLNTTAHYNSKYMCENGGECYQDKVSSRQLPLYPCTITSLCVCPTCFIGTKCQLNTNEYSLSLDAILGYHIHPNIHISRQNAAVLTSLILSMIICFIGIVNAFLTFITFKQKKARDAGFGIYLLCTSFDCLFIVILLTLKVWILVFSHIGTIQNRFFLAMQCYSIDFLLRVSLTMNEWITAFVAIERAHIIMKGVTFNKNKMKLIAKRVLICLPIILIGTNIHDSLNRRLFDEETDEEKRIWCLINYPPIVNIFNSFITTFYIIIPFIINFVSAIIIIFVNTRQRRLVKKQEKYQQILYEQIQQHRNLLIAPTVLILLTIPRLIIIFVPGCMKSSGDSWLFLAGYFLSFIPPLLTFILFVLPSTTYSQIFTKAMSQYRKLIRIRRQNY